MTKFGMAWMVLLASMITVNARAALNDPEKVPTQFQRVFIPEGFDSNDHVQIVATGNFENGCYRPAETLVKIDRDQKRITLTPMAYKYTGICLQAVLRFDKVVDLGILPTGDYQIFQAGDNKALGHITIKTATKSEPDDYPYAPVSQALVDGDGPSTELVLKGEFPTDCMHITEVKLTESNDVVVAQPIVDVDKREGCAMGFFPFRKVIPISIRPGRYLLHIRSMNGNAVNNVVQVK